MPRVAEPSELVCIACGLFVVTHEAVVFHIFSLQEIHGETGKSHCSGIEIYFTLGLLLGCSFCTSEEFPSDTTSALLREAVMMLSMAFVLSFLIFGWFFFFFLLFSMK